MNEAPRGLSDLATPDLEALLRAVQRGQVDCPLSKAGLASAGFGACSGAFLAALDDMDLRGVEAALAIAIAERVHRPPPRLDLVWTGPEARTATTRDTAIVVRQLFEQARKSVVVGGFRFDHGEELLRPLHAVMRDHGVKATFFLDIADHADRADRAEAYATEQIDRFFADNWPFGPPRPDVYYDPRTAVPGPPWASLHAKCVVVDERVALITSANFTERGQERNVEAGVLIEDERFASSLVAQWRSLIGSGGMERYRG